MDLVARLMQEGVVAIGRPADGSEVVTQDAFEAHYAAAFGHEASTVVVIGRDQPEDQYVLGSTVDELWTVKDQIPGGIRRVLSIPNELWEELRSEIDAGRLHNLTTAGAPA